MIALIDYGAGNLRSVEFALDRLGVGHRRVARPSELRGARGVILPGVGAAASAMAELSARGWPAALRDTSLPLLGVCLGMQLLCDYSEEGGERTNGLGLVPGSVARFDSEPAPGTPSRLPVPHIGWARVQARPMDPLFEGIEDRAWFYFLHSYRAECPCTVVSATADYGESFPAALRSDRVAGVQFHPEKSGQAGERLLSNFCAGCAT